MRPRRGSRPVCSGCHKPAAAYDHLSLRRFEFVPLWGCMVVLLYCMRRVDCRACGVRVEAVPWGIGKHQLTKAYMLFLADSGDREQSVHSIMNTDSGDHEHLFAPA